VDGSLIAFAIIISLHLVMHNHYFTEILHILRKNRVPDSKIRFALLQKSWTKTRSLALY
jgi:hypothetical protein